MKFLEIFFTSGGTEVRIREKDWKKYLIRKRFQGEQLGD